MIINTPQSLHWLLNNTTPKTGEGGLTTLLGRRDAGATTSHSSSVDGRRPNFEMKRSAATRKSAGYQGGPFPGEGQTEHIELAKLDVLVKLLIDSAVAYTMEEVDLVFVGADGVVESGGIINMLPRTSMNENGA